MTSPKTLQIWKFSHGIGRTKIEGTFPETQEAINWLIGKTATFTNLKTENLTTHILLEEQHFTKVDSDHTFARQFKELIGTTGSNPFDNLNEEDAADYDNKFGENRPKTTTKPVQYVDENTQITTYGLTTWLLEDDTQGYDQDPAEMDRFLTEFELLNKEEGIFPSKAPERYDYGTRHCIKIIRRKADGKLYGLKYVIDPNSNDIFNRGENIFDSYETKDGPQTRRGYIWKPVTPITIQGYELTKEVEKTDKRKFYDHIVIRSIKLPDLPPALYKDL